MFIVNSETYFRCKICSNILEKPIVLPCGQTVCQSHSVEISSINFIFCSKLHPMQENGFPLNQMVQCMLENNLHTLKINSNKLNQSKKKIEDLNNCFREIELLNKDPEYYIYDYFNELKRQVDLKREFLIETVQNHSNNLIETIDTWKKTL